MWQCIISDDPVPQEVLEVLEEVDTESDDDDDESLGEISEDNLQPVVELQRLEDVLTECREKPRRKKRHGRQLPGRRVRDKRIHSNSDEDDDTEDDEDSEENDVIYDDDDTDDDDDDDDDNNYSNDNSNTSKGASMRSSKGKHIHFI